MKPCFIWRVMVAFCSRENFSAMARSRAIVATRWLVSVWPVGAELLARSPADLVMPALVVGDRGKHFFRRVFHVQLGRSYGTEAECSDSGLLEEGKFGHPVGLCYSFLRVEVLLVKFVPGKSCRVPVLGEGQVERLEHPVVRNSPVSGEDIEVQFWRFVLALARHSCSTLAIEELVT